MLKYREMTEADNEAVATLVRNNLIQFGLDIPGTVYFDEGLDHLSDYYGTEERRYFVIEDGSGKVIGGIGFARFEPMEDTAELQKLYLDDSAKGSGLGYELVDFIEGKMRDAGYKVSYAATAIILKRLHSCSKDEIEGVLDRVAEICDEEISVEDIVERAKREAGVDVSQMATITT